MKNFSVLFGLLAVLTPSMEAFSFRCGMLSFFGNDRACRASCYLTGHTTGECHGGECICSEDDNDVSQDVEDLLGGVDVQEFVSGKIGEFRDTMADWDIEEQVKRVLPSRCQIGESTCVKTCQGLGHVSGNCSEDNTDCECTDERVSAKQYALCLEDGVCRMYCQNKGFAFGQCAGDTNWDCACRRNNRSPEVEAPWEEV